VAVPCKFRSTSVTIKAVSDEAGTPAPPEDKGDKPKAFLETWTGRITALGGLLAAVYFVWATILQFIPKHEPQPSSSPTPAPVPSQTTPLVTTSAPALTSTATPTPVASTAASPTPLPTFETQKMVLPDKDQLRLKEILVSFLHDTSTEINLDLLKQREIASQLVDESDQCLKRWYDENRGDHGIEKILSKSHRAKDLWDQVRFAISSYQMDIKIANKDIDDPAAPPDVTEVFLKDGESERRNIDRCVRNLAGYVGISL
jgi:hypothetical protein